MPRAGAASTGGGEVDVDAPLDRIPVFVRVGAAPEVVGALRAALGVAPASPHS